MDWKQEATDRLRQLDRLRHSVRSMGQEVKLLREEMGALQGVDTARVAVRGSGWNDDALVGTLVKLGELEGVLGRTKCRIREALGLAGSGVYRRRDKALREFTIALYGVGN